MTPIETAVKARDVAQAHLDEVLASGGNPGEARAELERAEQAIVALQEAQAAAEAAEAAEVEAQADELVAQVRAETASIIKGIFSAISGPPAPTEIDRAYAVVWAKARRTHAAAHQALEIADERVRSLQTRLDDMAAERAAIGGRRSRGDCRDTDRGDVELIALDIENTEAAIARAQAERAKLASVEADARKEMDQGRNLIAVAREDAITATVREAQPEIEAALLGTAKALQAHCPVTRPHWELRNVTLRNIVEAHL